MTKIVESKRRGEDDDTSMYGFTSSVRVPLRSVVRVSVDSVDSKRVMSVPHEAMEIEMRLL